MFAVMMISLVGCGKVSGPKTIETTEETTTEETIEESTEAPIAEEPASPYSYTELSQTMYASQLLMSEIYQSRWWKMRLRMILHRTVGITRFVAQSSLHMKRLYLIRLQSMVLLGNKIIKKQMRLLLLMMEEWGIRMKQ